MIEKVFEKEEKDIFVATYSAFENEDTGEICTWATWSDGIPTYLPKVDMVALGRGETDEDYETLGFVPWSQFQKIFGPWIQKTAEYPERYFVTDFPDASVLNEVQFIDL